MERPAPPVSSSGHPAFARRGWRFPAIALLAGLLAMVPDVAAQVDADRPASEASAGSSGAASAASSAAAVPGRIPSPSAAMLPAQTPGKAGAVQDSQVAQPTRPDTTAPAGRDGLSAPSGPGAMPTPDSAASPSDARAFRQPTSTRTPADSSAGLKPRILPIRQQVMFAGGMMAFIGLVLSSMTNINP